MVKQAEVNGVIAGLADSGYIKLASEEDFDTVCGIVAENISDKDWTFDEVVEKTAEVMEEVYAIYEESGKLEKEASEGNTEYTEGDIMAAIGELTLAKEAGDVGDEEAESKMKKLKDMLMANKGKVVGGAVGLAALGALASPKVRGYIGGRASAGNNFKSGLLDDLKTVGGKAKETASKVGKGSGALYNKVLDKVSNPPSSGSNFKRTFKYFKGKQD